jgi:excisionase family DNA binding protein
MNGVPYFPNHKIVDWGEQCKAEMTDLQFQMACGQAMQDGLKALAVDIVSEAVKQLKPPAVETILPLAEAAKTLHVKPCTLRRMVEKGKIGFIADAKSYFFKVSDLNAYLEKHYTPAQN